MKLELSDYGIEFQITSNEYWSMPDYLRDFIKHNFYGRLYIPIIPSESKIDITLSSNDYYELASRLEAIHEINQCQLGRS